MPSCSIYSRSCSRHHISAGARLRILASALGCWQQFRSITKAPNKAAWLTSPSPSTPVAANDATPLTQSSNSPDATMDSRSGRCDWPTNSLLQFAKKNKISPARPALPREMLCVHQTNQWGSKPVRHFVAGACVLHVDTACTQPLAAPDALECVPSSQLQDQWRAGEP